ncbi:hypothetical protein NMG60_11019997 [Bertholletia excelsa]
MDFHSLARRDLQTLCKKNKIPANMTNVAMADALSALEIVEGIEEFLKPLDSEATISSVESPEKTVIATPCVPRTSCRTSTGRKVIQEEPAGAQILTRTRRSTRRMIAGEVENPKPEPPATPAMLSSRKGAPVASARRKMEPLGDQKEEASVRQGYSTRRSTRLLEKQMMQLNLNDNEGIESNQVDASDKEMPKSLERSVDSHPDDSDNASVFKGINQQTISDNLLVKNDDSKDISDEKSGVLSEHVRELEDTVQECGEPKSIFQVVDESVDAFFPNEHEQMLVSVEKGEDSDNEGADKNNGEDCGEFDILKGEITEISPVTEDNIPVKEECGESGLDSLPPVNGSPIECLAFENRGQMNTGKFLDSKNSLVLSSGSRCCDVMKPEVVPESPMLEKTNQPSREDPAKPEIEDQKDMESENFRFSNDVNEVQNFESAIIGGESEDKASRDDVEVYLDILEHSFSVEELKKGELLPLDCLNCREESVNPVAKSSNKDGWESEMSGTRKSAVANNASTDTITTSDENMIDSKDKMPDKENTATALKRPSFEKPTSPVISSAKVLVDTPFSTLAADPCQGQMASNLVLGFGLDHIISPASLTPVKKSLNKTPISSQKINSLLDSNKENIDNSGRNLDLAKEKGMKDKNDTAEAFYDKSLRELKKLVKEKLQITNKTTINEDNIVKVGRGRPALQALSDNCLVAGKSEMEN